MSLFNAIRAGDVAQVEELLAAGEDANLLGDRGRTPLMAAAETGNEQLVRAVLSAGGEPFLTDSMGETALIIAAAHGHAAVCQLLMPHASEDERDMARRLLRDAGKTELPPGPPPEGPGPSETRRKLAAASAYVANKLGDAGPTQRLARFLRSEKDRK